MLRPRLSVFLMYKDRELIKSKNFIDSRYLGDPLNAVNIYNDMNIDELIIMDVGASIQNKTPNYELIENIGAIARMPVCYGGGIKNINQIEKIISFGIEKVSISSEAYCSDIIIKSSQKFGSQSIVCCIDVRFSDELGKYEVFTHRGTQKINKSLEQLISFFHETGAGEIIFNDIDRDGTYKGFDQNLLSKVFSLTKIPISFVGGLSSLDEVSLLSNKFGNFGIAAGSLWSFLGQDGPVLINYPINRKKSLFK